MQHLGWINQKCSEYPSGQEIENEWVDLAIRRAKVIQLYNLRDDYSAATAQESQIVAAKSWEHQRPGARVVQSYWSNLYRWQKHSCQLSRVDDGDQTAENSGWGPKQPNLRGHHRQENKDASWWRQEARRSWQLQSASCCPKYQHTSQFGTRQGVINAQPARRSARIEAPIWSYNQAAKQSKRHWQMEGRGPKPLPELSRRDHQLQKIPRSL